MDSIRQIIDACGGWDALAERPITLTVSGFMPLHIERIGTGPRGYPLLAVSHTYEQNGDLMRDPEIVMEVLLSAKWWLPVSYRQDGLGFFQEVVKGQSGNLVVNSRLVNDLRQFMLLWDRNIRAQGFVAAARNRG